MKHRQRFSRHFTPLFCRSRARICNDVTVAIRDRDGIDISSRLLFSILDHIESLIAMIGAGMSARNTKDDQEKERKEDPGRCLLIR
jgi:hypothetical protein